MVTDLYRGITKKEKNTTKANANKKLRMFERGKGCSEEDIQRFVRNLLIDGYLEEKLKKFRGVPVEICYVNISKTGKDFIKKKDPRVKL